jgi:hypothetical protein
MMNLAINFGIPSMNLGVAFGPTLVLLFAAVAALGFATSARGTRRAARRVDARPARGASAIRPAHAV